MLNPYFDNPTKFIAYEADDVKEEVTVIPVNTAAKPYIKAMENFYGINRIELKTFDILFLQNSGLLKKHILFLQMKPTKREVKKQIDDMISDRYLFAGMNRYFNMVL